jgi:hypothetical protein
MTAHEPKFLSTMMKAISTEDDTSQEATFCSEVFIALGLLRDCEDGRKPTQLLYKLVLTAALKQLQ